MDELSVLAKQHRALTEMAKEPSHFLHCMARSNAQDATYLQACGALDSDEFLRSSYLEDAVRQYLLSKRLKHVK